ncbi:RagB/SusD family nutrient uptake outer membrane protein [Parapedobacter sp. 10938]|uniref:RagB/SusD family nutrient uptake outer membrane protein n=1 Tax=Parapedobacter flavus TaxID=3110225 RepID=UPI002DBBF26B|nr:RagB/SusD family nutrient uptake outer membrane protein [Parapedobacter sp. 10938]MEC3880127.1 RagB/SusD family nutrient uptake outer membrane protein [Parapedobacter sp. 10938]
MRKHPIVLLLALAFSSCNYMDEFPYDWAQPEDVFSMEHNYERPINQAYSFLTGGFNRISGSFLGAATDDGMSTIRNSAIHRLSRAYVNASSPVVNPWEVSYQGIRQALFVQKSLAEIDLVLNNKSAEDVLEIKNTYSGEMYALRAWYAFDLLRHYGGFPIIDKYYTLGDPELAVKQRNTFDACVNHIVSLCDSAATYLAVNPVGGGGGFGRMTKGAALAVKAKTLLFAASPLFNQAGNTNPLIGYVSPSPADIQARWEAAAAACIDVIQLKRPNGSDMYTLHGNYAKLFTSSPNREYILFVGATRSNGLENRQFPPSLSRNSGGGTVPTQEFVDAFTRADGSDFVRSDATDPYTGRDPRFGATVGFNGSKYGPQGTIYTQLGQGATMDGLNVTIDRSTNTGYYLKKFLDFSIDFSSGNPGQAFHLFPLIRLADVLLCYAEAMNEAYGPDADPHGYGLTAKDAVDAVRERAGFKNDTYLDGVTDVATMRDKVKQERRVELSFEEQRYFDLRRWLDGDLLGQPVSGVRIEQAGNQTTVDYFAVDEQRKFQPNMYLHPIPLREIRISPQIEQNPGW